VTVNGGYPPNVAAHVVITDSSGQGRTFHEYTLQVTNVNGQVAVPAGGQAKVHDIRVMEQAVQEADRGGVLGKEPAPLVERSAGGHPERAALVG